jgi:hypothetical protein
LAGKQHDFAMDCSMFGQLRLGLDHTLAIEGRVTSSFGMDFLLSLVAIAAAMLALCSVAEHRADRGQKAAQQQTVSYELSGRSCGLMSINPHQCARGWL